MLKELIFILVLISLIPNVLADYCIGNFTKMDNITLNGINYEWNKSCPYGCENGSCTPSPLVQFLIFIGIVIVIVIIIILTKKAGLT